MSDVREVVTRPTGPFTTTHDRVAWSGDGETVVVEAWGPDSIRIRAALGEEVVDDRWALLDPAAGAEPTVEVDGDTAVLTNGAVVARLEAERWHDDGAGYVRFRCRVTITDRTGRVLLQELGPGGSLKRQARQWQPLPGGAHRLTASFEAQPGERLYGMGLYQEGLFDLKGATLELAHRNSQASVPFVVSSLGYGMLWHDPAIGRVAFGTNRTEWTAESTAQLDYWVTVGTPAGLTRRYADATGHVPPMPERGLGFWQSKLRYSSQQELLRVAHEHKRRGLPLDVIVADFFHWPHMGDYRFEDEFWPDPAAMVQELASMHIELMVSVWPQVSLDSEQYEHLRRSGALVRTERGLGPQMGFEGPSMFVDFTAQAGRELVWQLCRQNYFDLGIRTFWLDEAEPEWGVYDFDAYRYSAGPVSQVGNLYPQQYARAFWDGQHAAGQDDVVNLIRCAWAGSQRYGALVWSGDISSTWQDLRHQVVAGMQMGLAGIPWFTTDIGGFHDGDPEDPAFRELLVRWFQYGTFCPVMRLHGDRTPRTELTATDGSHRSPTGGPNEVWSFGSTASEILADHLQLRERLRPYLRQVMAEAHALGQPVIRTLFHEFPDDAVAWTVSDQYLLGPSLLVAPVLQPGARTRTVHLPGGATWIEASTGVEHEGGQVVTAQAPLDVIPVFIRGGTADESALRSVMQSPATRPDHGTVASLG